MDALINFKIKGHLFECDPNEFNTKIKNVLSNILIHRMEYFMNNDVIDIRKIRCIICWQFELDNSWFLICEECCKTCINYSVLISIVKSHIYICHVTCDDYWDDLDSCSELIKRRERFYKNKYYHDKSSFLKYFVTCSFKLIHRFYHAVPILFLLSLHDQNSDCYTLNKDVIMCIFNFIY